MEQRNEDYPASTDRGGVGHKARSGAIWIVGGFAFGQLSRLVTNIFLAAILFEEAFALMAIVSAFMIGLAMFSDIGLQTNVIQSPRGDEPDFLNTAWTLQVIRGGVLFLIALLISWPVSRIYGANDPKAFELFYLMPIMALATLIAGFQSAKIMSAARHLKVKETVKIEFIVGPFNLVITLLLAWYTKSVYSLPIASVLSNVLYAILSYTMLDGPKSSFRWDPIAVRSIISFGKWVFLSTLISFLALQIDRLVFAGMYPLASVGIYSIAASLALMVPTLMGALQNSIAFPMYSRLKDKGMPLNEAYRLTRMPLMVGTTFLSVLLVVGASSFFELAYDDRYAEGALYLPILAFSVWFSSINGMYGSVFLANSNPHWIAYVSAARVLSFVLILFLLEQFNETMFVAVFAVLLSDIIALGVSQFLGRRVGLFNLKAEASMLLIFILTGTVGWWFVHNISVVSDQPPWLRLLLVGVFEMVLFAPLAWRTVKPLLELRRR
jgi:O-antigen/teichoic acid export membrane protein